MTAGRRLSPALLLVAAAAARADPAAQTLPPAFEAVEATIDSVQEALRSGRATCRFVVERYLQRIEAYDKKGPSLNAVQTMNPHALEEADALDAALRRSGPVGALHCVPILVKDQIETQGIATSSGSVLFRDYVPEQDATAVARLKRAGAIVLAKSTMGEFASRYVGSASGIPRNAYDPARNPSGSSSGTGSGVAASFGVIGLGEDTGGSIRGPAEAGSLVGLRPTLPVVSRHGTFPSRPSTDTLGPIARTVRDAALLLDAIAGYDPNDPATAESVGHVPPSYAAVLAKDGLRGARIGVLRAPMEPRTEPDSEDYRKVRALVDTALADLRSQGAELVDPVAIPDVKDWIRRSYGANDYETEPAVDRFLAERPKAPVKSLREMVDSGRIVPWRARGLADNLGKSIEQPGYLGVLLAQRSLRGMVLKAMADERLDALVYATSDHQPTAIAPDVLTNPRPRDDYTKGSNRHFASALGFPAITVPAGFTSDGLPVGIELLARPFAEPTLFRFAYAYEQATRRRRPPPLLPALPDR